MGYEKITDPLSNMDPANTLIVPEYSLVRKSILFSMWGLVDAQSEYFGIVRGGMSSPEHKNNWLTALCKLYLLVRSKSKEGKDKGNQDYAIDSEIKKELEALITEDETPEDARLKVMSLELIDYVERLGITNVQNKPKSKTEDIIG